MNLATDKYGNLLRRAMQFKIAELGLGDFNGLARHYGVSRRTVSGVIAADERSAAQQMIVEALVDFCDALHRNGERP